MIFEDIDKKLRALEDKFKIQNLLNIKELLELKVRVAELELKVDAHSVDKQAQERANFNERARQHGLVSNTIYTEEMDGQANTQDRKGSQERPKGHKKALKDG